MVKNKIGFASTDRYKLKPNYYKNIFNGWCAIYLIGDEEYHIQLNPDFWNNEFVRDISVLVQRPTHRHCLRKNLKTVKSAVEALEKIKERKECI